MTGVQTCALPISVSVTLVPPQTSVLVALMLIVGLEVVNTTWLAQVVHPKLLVPATEYKVGAVGVAVYVAPFVVPGYQV